MIFKSHFSGFTTLVFHSHTPKKYTILSFAFWLDWTFLPNPSRPSNKPLFLHHPNIIWGPIAASLTIWKFLFKLCFFKAFPWQFGFRVEPSKFELKFLQVFFIPKHSGLLFELAATKPTLQLVFLPKQVSARPSLFIKPCYAMPNPCHDESIATYVMLNVWFCWEKIGFHSFCVHELLPDLFCWGWLNEFGHHICAVWCLMMLLVQLILSSEHFDFPAYMKMMIMLLP